MLMLQKLENAYLAILRFVVLIVAGLLLVGVVLMGVNALKAVKSEPVVTKTTPQVSDQEMIKAITSKPSAATPSNPGQGEGAHLTQVDPNSAYYDRVANVIVSFVTKNSGGTDSVERGQVITITKARAEAQKDPELIAAFAKNFAEVTEKSLGDQSVVNTARHTSALDVVNNALNTFTEKFNKQVEAANAEKERKQQEYLNDKAEGMQSLYYAAGAFGAFLMIVFLSIIIRIERNLRNLERLPEEEKSTPSSPSHNAELAHQQAR